MLFWLLVLFVGTIYIVHRRMQVVPTLTIAAAYLIIMGIFSDTPAWLMTLFWLIWLLTVFLVAGAQIRQMLISKPLYNWLRKTLPPISDTERDAIEAGTVWWDGELFSGKPNWQTLLNYPKPVLSEEEQAFIDGPTETLCAMVDDWQIGQRMDLPEEAWQYIKQQGFFGLIIPQSYGGKGFSAYAHSQIVMKLATRSGDLASTVMVPNSLGPAELLLRYGTQEQQQTYLPRLANGDDIPCFALTSPHAGSDAAGMTDVGIVCKGQWNGCEVLGLKLNWEKRYITLGPVATLLGLAFKCYDPDRLLGGETDLGITLALIPTNTEGVEIGDRHLPLGAAFMNGPNRGKDVFIPLDNVIGGQEMIGQGWMMLMNCLSVGRSISLPAVGTSVGKFCSYVSGRYAAIREQFHVPLAAFEGIQEPLARLGGNAWLMDCARIMTAGAVDLGEKPSVLSAILKYHLTERGRECIAHAMDIHGGKGIIMGPKNYLGRVWQAAPIFITVEGANILSRNLMIFGQGAIRCHPYILQEMELANRDDQDEAMRIFDQILWQHIGFAVSNAASSFLYGLTFNLLGRVPGDRTSRPYFRALNRLSANFALLADVSMMLLGGKLKRKERLSARLGDALSYLYLGSAALKRYHDLECPKHLRPLVCWSMEESLFRAEKALSELLDNFPNRGVACLMRVLVFPFGKRHKGPSDRLSRKVAAILTQPLDAPELQTLIDGVYRTRDIEQPIGALEHAFDLMTKHRPDFDKLRKAQKHGQLTPEADESLIEAAIRQGLIQPDEAARLGDIETAQRKIIDVDAFDPDTLKPCEGHIR